MNTLFMCELCQENGTNPYEQQGGYLPRLHGWRQRNYTHRNTVQLEKLIPPQRHRTTTYFGI